MYYISVKDFVGTDLSTIGLNPTDIDEVISVFTREGPEGIANYLNKENIQLRDEILSKLGMDLEQRVEVRFDHHRTLNGEGTSTYEGTRWIGRTKEGNSIHEVFQDILSNDKYEGIAEETGCNIRETNRKFLKANPVERLSIVKKV